MGFPQLPQPIIPWQSAMPSRGGRAPAAVWLAASLASLARKPAQVMYPSWWSLITTGHSDRGRSTIWVCTVPPGVDSSAGGVPAEDVRSRIRRVLQDPRDAGVGELAPPQLTGPRSAVGPQRELAAGEGGDHRVGRAAGG